MQSQNKSWIVSPAWDLTFLINDAFIFIIGYFLIRPKNIGDWQVLLAFISIMHLFSPYIMSTFLGPVSEVVGKEKRSLLTNGMIVAVFSLSLIFIGMLGKMEAAPRWLSSVPNGLIFAGLIYFVWNTWHSGGQIFGILSLYRMRAQKNSARDKFLDKWFCRWTLCVCVPLAKLTEPVTLYASPFKLLNIINHFPVVSGSTFGLLVGLPAIAMISRELYNGTTLPRLLYIVNIVVIPIMGLTMGGFVFLLLLDINHWISDVALSSLVATRNLKEKKSWKWSGSLAAVACVAVFAGVAGIYMKVGCGLVGLQCNGRILAFDGQVASITNAIQLSFIVGFHFSLSLVHFYMSGKTYHFSSPIYGQKLSRLFLK